MTSQFGVISHMTSKFRNFVLKKYYKNMSLCSEAPRLILYHFRTGENRESQQNVQIALQVNQLVVDSAGPFRAPLCNG